jgi:hypothetical protein
MHREKDSHRKVPLWVRGALSALIAFHLFIVILMPNSNTWLGLKALAWLQPYVHALELTPQWNFFAPDPGPPPIFVEWELEDEKGEAIGKGSLPERWDPYLLRERQNRRIALTRFLVLSDSRTERVMLSYLCRRHPEASAVTLWRTVYSTPSLTAVASGERKIGDEVGMQRRWVSHSFCGGGPS